MKARDLKAIFTIALMLYALSMLGSSCDSSPVQGRRSRPAPRDMGNRRAQGNLRERYLRLVQEMRSKGYDVSQAEALNEQAMRAVRSGNREQARKFVAEAVVMLESLGRRGPQTSPKEPKASAYTFAEKKELSIAVSAAKARMIETFPSNADKISDNTLENFKVSELEADKGQIVVEINYPVIIEEYPYSDMSLKHNQAFGATGSGVIKRPNRSASQLNSVVKKNFKMMAQAGLGLARDFQSYDTRREIITTPRGQHDYSMSDFAVGVAIDEGFDFIGRVGVHEKMREEGPPKDEAAYIAYIKSTVTRYKDKVKIWQVLKEPSPTKRGRPGNDAGLQPKDVKRILELSYTTIKSVDPSAIVYFPGLGAPIKRGPYTDESYLSEIVALGGAKYFDAIGFDAYVWDIEDEAQKYRRILKKYGYNKPVWVAQTSVLARDIDKQTTASFHGRGGSDRAQAEFMVKAYARSFAIDIKKVFWGEFIDESREEGIRKDAKTIAVDQTGLFWTGVWQVKPAYFTHRLLATALDSFTEAKRVSANMVKFTFANRSPVYVVWP